MKLSMIGMKDIKTTRYIGLLLAVCAMSIFSCTSEIDELPSTESPIGFSLSFPEDENPSSRVGKEVFSNGDQIYVTATITTITPGSVTGEVRKTKVMTYNSTNKNWTQEGDILTWPKDAVSGSFVAYYLPRTRNTENNEIINKLTDTQKECTINFEDLRDATDDPLMATKENIPHNGVVNLQFTHMLTRLRATGLRPTTRTVTFRCEGYKLHDRIVFTYDEIENKYRHEFQFADDNEGLTMNILQTNPNDKDETSTLFFVHMNSATEWEDNLTNFKLDQKDKDTKLVIDPPTSLSESTLYNMQKGRSYTIYFYSGNDKTTFEENENWYTDKKKYPAFTSEEEIKAYFAGLTSAGLQEDLDLDRKSVV